jgi:CheY-like chemotaxis protein
MVASGSPPLVGHTSVLGASAARRPSRRPRQRKDRATRAGRRVPALRSQAALRSRLPHLAGLDLVVVEDHADARELLRQMLTSLGARVRIAEDASSGLALLEQGRPDVILLDLMLPGMDGLEFAGHVHRDPRWSTVPILAVTALGGLADYIQTWTRGFAGHLTKPVDQEQLARAIRDLAGKRRRR